MDADLTRRMEREREFWVDVAPGKRIKFLRPLLDEARYAVTGIKECCEYVRGWEGIVESDLLTTGGTAEVEFDAAIASTLLRDHMGWAKKVAIGMASSLKERHKQTEAAEKNSVTSSTLKLA